MTPNLFLTFLRHEWQRLVTVQKSDRPWQMPVAAALASGLPLLVGCAFGHLEYGLISSLGGMVFLNLPATPMHHRMVTLMAASFAMTASYALGVLSHLFPPMMMVALTFTAVLVTMLTRYYRMGPPGGAFFIMAAAIGAYSPCAVLEIPLKTGLIFLGCLLATLVAFFYSLVILRKQPSQPAAPLPPATFDYVIFDAVIIGGFIGLTLFCAQFLQLEKAYWAPVSCLVVIQGASMRAIWEKQFHRVLGTGVGLLVAWGLLSLPFNAWSLSFAMMALAFIVETAVVRHYGFAAIFITPMTILLAEAAHLTPDNVAPLIEARFFDTLLGCVMGLIGGFCLHSPRFRASVGGWMRHVIPQRLRSLPSRGDR
ncbi:MAG: FUSC family protein [Zoogloeaceae bacterium]|jgi:hypothetical protein|nr:FUSC family protein [Zoogloeaceae bacterium]